VRTILTDLVNAMDKLDERVRRVLEIVLDAGEVGDECG
jgi:hypothetical protein